MVYEIVFLILGILAFAESIVFLIFPKSAVKFGRLWFRNAESVRKVAMIELLVGLILILIGISL
jgi:hypothetical protein